MINIYFTGRAGTGLIEFKYHVRQINQSKDDGKQSVNIIE